MCKCCTAALLQCAVSVSVCSSSSAASTAASHASSASSSSSTRTLTYRWRCMARYALRTRSAHAVAIAQVGACVCVRAYGCACVCVCVCMDVCVCVCVQSFCFAAKDGFVLLLENALRVAALQTVAKVSTRAAAGECVPLPGLSWPIESRPAWLAHYVCRSSCFSESCSSQWRPSPPRFFTSPVCFAQSL